jgi:chromosome segregation ATPase
MRLAIESYITHGGGGKEGEDLTRAKEDLTLKDREIASLKQQLLVKEHEGENVTKNLTTAEEDLIKAREDLTLKDGEITHIKQLLLVKEHEGEALAKAKEDLSQLKADAELKWRETNQLRSEINQAKRELETSRGKIEQLQTEIEKKRDEAYQACNEAESLRRDQDHYKDTLAMKDKQIGFLEGHVSQLTQSISQFALPPSQEEAKAKHWWRFWR